MNASARKSASGCAALIVLIAHSQNANALVCGLSTRKIVTPWSIQNSKIARSSTHIARQCVGLEVERDDVLVLLRRVLRVLDRAVGAPAEELRVLADAGDGRARPGTRCRARSAMPCSAAASTSARTSSSVPSSGWTAVWPPSAEPIAHGLPGSLGPLSVRLLGPLRNARPIGWIGGR